MLKTRGLIGGNFLKNFQLRLFEISGRFSRTRFVLQCLGTFILGALGIWLLAGITVQLGAQAGAIPALLIFAIFIVLFASLITASIRRLHDIGRSGWVLLIPLIYGFLLLFFFFGIQFPKLLNPHNQTLMPLALLSQVGGILLAGIPVQLFCCWIFIWPGVEGDNSYGKDPRSRPENYTPQRQIFLEEFFSFRGRVDRSFFIRAILCLVLVMNFWEGNLQLLQWNLPSDYVGREIKAIFSIIFVQSPISSLIVMLFTVIILLALFISLSSLVVRRFHDLNLSGWYGVSLLIVLATRWIPNIGSYFFFAWWLYIFSLAWRQGISEGNLFGEKVLRTFPKREDKSESEQNERKSFL